MEQTEPKIEKPIISYDRDGNKYEGGEIFEGGIMPEDFDSSNPITRDAEGNLVRGGKPKESPEPKIEKSAYVAMSLLNGRWDSFLKGSDLKQMTAEQIEDAVSKIIGDVSHEFGWTDPNPYSDDTEQDQ